MMNVNGLDMNKLGEIGCVIMWMDKFIERRKIKEGSEC